MWVATRAALRHGKRSLKPDSCLGSGRGLFALTRTNSGERNSAVKTRRAHGRRAMRFRSTKSTDRARESEVARRCAAQDALIGRKCHRRGIATWVRPHYDEMIRSVTAGCGPSKAWTAERVRQTTGSLAPMGVTPPRIPRASEEGRPAGYGRPAQHSDSQQRTAREDRRRRRNDTRLRPRSSCNRMEPGIRAQAHLRGTQPAGPPDSRSN